jgi:hypothetical protein
MNADMFYLNIYYYLSIEMNAFKYTKTCPQKYLFLRNNH